MPGGAGLRARMRAPNRPSPPSSSASERTTPAGRPASPAGSAIAAFSSGAPAPATPLLRSPVGAGEPLSPARLPGSASRGVALAAGIGATAGSDVGP